MKNKTSKACTKLLKAKDNDMLFYSLFLSSAHSSIARPDAWIEEARTPSTLDDDDDDADDHDHSGR